MRKRVIGLLLLATIVTRISGGAEPREVTREHEESLEKQKTQLEKEQKLLELKAAQTTSKKELDQIKIEQEQTAQTLQEIQAQLAATPHIAPVSPDTTKIPLTLRTTEQSLLQSTSIEDWVDDWKKYSEEPGFVYGKGGELFAQASPSQRAAKIVTIIEKTPIDVLYQDAAQAITTLLSIGQLAEYLKQKNYLSPRDPDKDYDQIMDAVTNKLEQVIQKGSLTADLDEQIGRWYMVAYDPIESSNLPDYAKTILIDTITKRVQSELAEKEKPLSPIDAIKLLSNIRKQVETKLKDHRSAQIALRKALLNEIVKVLDTTPFEKEEQGAQSLNKVAQAILTYAASGPGGRESSDITEAEIAIANRFNLYLDRFAMKKQQGILESVGQMAREYKALKEDLKGKISQKVLDNLGAKFLERVNPFIAEIKGESVADFDSLIGIVETIKKTDPDLLGQSPATLQHIANKMNTVITSELNNHTLIADAMATNGKDVYSAAYNKEVDLLTRYLSFITQYSLSIQKIPELELSSAKRLTRLNDLIEAQATYYKDKDKNVVVWLVSKLAGGVKNAIIKLISPDKITQLIKSSDPEFDTKESKQKDLFSKGPLEALPEDILARLSFSLDQLAPRFATVQKDALMPLTDDLITLYSQLYKPLVNDGYTEYGLDSLIINEADIARFKNTAAHFVQVINNDYLPKVINEEGHLGHSSDERKNIEKALRKIVDILQEKATGTPGASDLIKKLNEAFIATAKIDDQDGITLVTQVETLGNKIMQPTADLGSFKGSLDTVIDNLETVLQNLIDPSAVDVDTLLSALLEAQAWRDVVSMAEVVPTLTQGPQSAQVYTSLLETIGNIQFLIDYRSLDNFDTRVATMKKQAGALGKAMDVLSQQKVGARSASDLAAALYSFKFNLSAQIPADMVDTLKSLGYITQTAEGVVTLTDAGNELADIAREQMRTTKRKEQLEQYVKDYEGGAAPAKGLTIGTRTVPLADTIKYSWLILDDQLTALKDSYKQALGNSLEQTMVNMNKALDVRVGTVEESRARIAEIAQIAPDEQKELETIEGLGKQLGYTAKVSKDPAQLAAALGISDVNDPQVIGRLLGMTDEEIKQASPNDLSFMNNEEVRLKILQIRVVRQALDKQLAVQMKNSQDVAAVKLLLRDIDDILQDQKKQANQLVPIDPFFESLISLKLQMLDMSEEEAQQWSSSETLLKLMGALDGNVALHIDPAGLTGEMKTLAHEIGTLIKGSLTDVALWGNKLWLHVRAGTGTVVQYSAVPIAVVAALLTALGLRAATTATAGGTAAALAGPAAGAAAGAFTSTGYLPEFIGLVTGATAGGVLYYIGSKIKPGTETIQEMNKKLQSRGLDPYTIAKDEILAKSAWQRFKDLFKTTMTVRLETAGSQKGYNEGKTDEATNARNAFYAMLGVSPSVSRIELEEAIRQQQAVMETKWGVTRWLMARRYNKQYRIMVRRSYDAVDAQIEYMKMLNGIAVKALADSQQDKNGILTLIGDFWNKMVKGQPPISEQMLQKEQFDQLHTRFNEFYTTQIANLQALKRYVDENPDEINKATPFADTMFSDMFKALIDGRISDISTAYEQSFVQLLTELGFTPEQLAPITKKEASSSA